MKNIATGIKMDVAAVLIDNMNGTGGYTDPLIFAIPVTLVVIVILIVISATKIDSQQTRIRNEDRLLDTLERIRRENMEPVDADLEIESEPQSHSGENIGLFMGGLSGESKSLTSSSIAITGFGTVPEDSRKDTTNLDRESSTAGGEFPEATSRFDFEDDDDDFEVEAEPVKPPNAVCDPDGLCFFPLAGQSVEEARYIARAKRDGTYVKGQTEAEAAALSPDSSEAAPEPELSASVAVGASVADDSVHEVPSEDSAETIEEPAEISPVEPVAGMAPHEEETPVETSTEPAGASEEPADAAENATEEPADAAENATEEPAEPEETGTDSSEPTATEEPLDKPESKTSRLRRLKERLAGKGKFGRAILGVLSRADLEESDWEALEDELLSADFGVEATLELIEKLKTKQKVIGTKSAKEVRRMAKRMIGDFLDRHANRDLNLDVPEGHEGNTVGVLIVGVNGGGKTTTVGKLARFLVANRKSVVLGAADTFRAAAGEQLETWGSHVGVPVIRSEKDKADPASVAFDAAKAARDNGADVVLIDTAGRLQNKAGLMDELGKIKRVAEKQVPITEVLLVIDATTGQNALSQAKIFTEAVGVTGIVLTKLDGSAKGGVVVALQRELGIPVKLVGLGEGPDDLAPFVPGDFSDALLDA
ncbi:signal recognition particle-docking protein FtsY [Mobiluncus mulieris]|uniref:Signal recognition particle receptor FtsY n=1 Tax=Mobiluncus mulieris TaxID=2052 RepID=A0ABD4TYL6_9ACTO|nr:signal recognition particle-docking protein FtsY [Mobiluncus mulieris]MCU9969460.1 signal recognition particle-docking protein FtsY [Mobiluncus mulieris]MCU9973899.1 signal recognition particle-docking protein FtsY [Mobiluncus mulieris]MCV0009898.1 signal recognition particle-docking protein FtsY [Mobiluncus mulieris]NMX01719.1 signal recognition particle-docking protein FtsY [Mobiluncus mulieris]NMX20258.1 signal recognition particle-docking protein FtsY [Mobiluncus mulieris]